MPRILVLFGSESGNSQDVAERIGREAASLGLAATTIAMDAYDVCDLPSENQVIFVASTTGQGEVPRNMATFWRFLLRKTLPCNSLAGLQFAVFGLGDSGYLHYNVVAKKLTRRISSLGGQLLLPLGLGDDQHSLGYEAALDPWLTSLWTQLRRLLDLPPAAQVDKESPWKLTPPRFSIAVSPVTAAGQQNVAYEADLGESVAIAHAFSRLEALSVGLRQQHEPRVSKGVGHDPGNVCMATLTVNERITAPDHFQDTRHIELCLGEQGPTFKPGDVLSIFPNQDSSAVARLLARMGLSPQQRMRIELAGDSAGDQMTHLEASVGAFVHGVLDIHSASPRRYFFEVLQSFTTDQLQRDRLRYLASAEGREDLALYNKGEGRTVLEVLQDFGSARMPLEWLVQTCPRLRARQFSIASSGSAHPHEAHITLAVVNYRTPFKRRKLGLCSAWLAELQPGGKVPVWVETGVLHLPSDASKPYIMIGPGTGIAPFRAFLEERCVQKAAGVSVAPGYLYFGSRNGAKDYYYKAQLQELQREGLLAREGGLVTAFSRDQPQKVYVTHRLSEHSAQLYELLQQGAYVYVCGSAGRMPQEVTAVFRDQVLQVQGKMSAGDAQRYLQQLESAGRYNIETWS